MRRSTGSNVRAEPGKALVFGEALLDLFPERRVIGGAPLNVAVHLRRLGWQVALLTRLGRDDNGQRIEAFLQAEGVDLSLVEKDEDHPTGTVSISLSDDGSHSFHIHTDVAWDYIEGPARLPPADLFYWGTLAARSETGRRTLKRLLAEVSAQSMVFDVNLRQHYFNPSGIRSGLAAATIVKMNEEEKEVICQLLGLDPHPVAFFSPGNNLQWVCITRGAEGAELWSRNGEWFSVQAPQVEAVDTVGAGDAFCAGLIHGLATGQEPTMALERANHLTSKVLTTRGAIPSR